MVKPNEYFSAVFVALIFLTGTGQAAAGTVPPPGDTDGDGVLDAFDNCIDHFNPGARDTDVDGFGNRCDPDFNNDGIVNFPDLGILKAGFFRKSRVLDLDGDGRVNFVDLAIFKDFIFGPPGPSAPNTAPNGLLLDNDPIDAYAAPGTPVGNFSTIDPNPGDTHSYSLVGGAGDFDNNQFMIVGDELQTSAGFDPELCSSDFAGVQAVEIIYYDLTCSIRVQTADPFGGTFEQSFIIEILTNGD